MKVYAAMFAMVLAAPAFAADWAPAVTPESLAAVAVPAPAPAQPKLSGPRDGQNYTGAEELLIKEFGVTEVGMDIPESEVMRQNAYYQNAFCFEHALRLALTALLEDYKPGSPLSKELAAIGVLQTPSKSELKKARQRVFDSLNRRESLIAMVHPFKQYQPQNGEQVEKNWVFFLRLGGAAYWAVVDRSGETPAYVYGMK